VIDLHCHVLAGIDDGPPTTEDSVALARVAAAQGTRTIVATPHVSRRYGNDSHTIARLVQETNAALATAGVGLDVVAGAEIAMTRAADLAAEELSALALGGGPWLVIEPPFSSAAVGLDTLIFQLQDEGHSVVLAHPERCPAFHREPQLLESIVHAGVLTSITAGSLVGQFGGGVKRFALELIDAELVHNVASDAHDPEERPPAIGSELQSAGLAALAEWLTDEVPAAILAGEEMIPPRPHVGREQTASSRESWWRRGPLRRAW
jgi:protein-tyrosine phosphatase